MRVGKVSAKAGGLAPESVRSGRATRALGAVDAPLTLTCVAGNPGRKQLPFVDADKSRNARNTVAPSLSVSLASLPSLRTTPRLPVPHRRSQIDTFTSHDSTHQRIHQSASHRSTNTAAFHLTRGGRASSPYRRPPQDPAPPHSSSTARTPPPSHLHRRRRHHHSQIRSSSSTHPQTACRSR